MKQIAVVGQQLIHTYPYIANFNGCDFEKLEAYGKPWMVNMMRDKDLSPVVKDMRITRIWSPDNDEAGRVADACTIDKVCASLDEAIAGADGAIVLDEVLDSRTDIVEICLNAGLDVFADKVIAVDPEKTESLLALAEEKGAVVRSWSQMFFVEQVGEIRQMAPGGVAWLACRLGMEKVQAYGIHPISMLQAAFPGRVATYRPLCDGDVRSALLELESGTRIFLHTGPDVTFFMHLCYSNKDKTMLVKGETTYAVFQAAALAIVAAFERRPYDAPGPTEMREATRLLDCIVRGGSAGKEITPNC